MPEESEITGKSSVERLWIKRLSGTTKIVVLLGLSAIGMVSYDTFYLILLTVFAFVFYHAAHLQ